MGSIALAVASVTILGIVCAVLLSVASKVMYVATDERLAKVEAALPGANCGACGYPGCSGYAAALAADPGAATNLCIPGGAGVIRDVCGILGGEPGEVIQKRAAVRCGGGAGVRKKKMDYKGVQTCMAAKMLYGGEGACASGCAGYGDCTAACPSGAVCVEDGLARVIWERCTGCGLCAKACPAKIITMEDGALSVAVMCVNTEKGADVRRKCARGCTGCGRCARECPSGAIAINNFLSEIDARKCTGCGRCAEACPTHCIKILAGGVKAS